MRPEHIKLMEKGRNSSWLCYNKSDRKGWIMLAGPDQVLAETPVLWHFRPRDMCRINSMTAAYQIVGWLPDLGRIGEDANETNLKNSYRMALQLSYELDKEDI